jgi:hypothetical protein
MAKARFILTKEISMDAPRTLKITKVGAKYFLEFTIEISGEDYSDIPANDPRKNSHRDIDLDTELFGGEAKVRLLSFAGNRNSILEIKSEINSKIPGSGAVAEENSEEYKEKSSTS